MLNPKEWLELHDIVEIVSQITNQSKSHAKRVIDQGGVKVDDEMVKDYYYHLKNGSIIQIGKRTFRRIIYD